MDDVMPRVTMKNKMNRLITVIVCGTALLTAVAVVIGIAHPSAVIDYSIQHLGVAIGSLGLLGDSSDIPRLSHFMKCDSRRAPAAEAAIRRINERLGVK